MDPTELEDLRLARRALDDTGAAKELFERIGPRVAHMVRLLVGKDEEVEDLIHGCLLTVLENLGKYKGTGPLEAWAGQLTYRVLMRQLKRKRRSERTVSLVPEERGVSTFNPERTVARKGMMEQLERHLGSIPEKRRTALVLRILYGHSVAEIAALTETPVNTVRDRIRIGLKELRAGIGANAISAELFGRRDGD